MLAGLKAQELYLAAPEGTVTRWISPENPAGEKGMAGLTNRGAKGNAFYIIAPGERKVIFDIKGAGIINRMWFSGSIAKSPEQRRAVRIDMYWDGEAKPAVSAPIGDFFGIAHGIITKFESSLFASPEGRSFLFNIPMPFRKSGLITVTNESSSEVWLWYDINYQLVNKVPKDALYFHAYWNREIKTTPGKDYAILPGVEGKGRYLGTNIGVIGDTVYNGTWFGEGEVKVFLDGDTDNPTLAGTGTEDYIGSGWGQGEFSNLYSGSVVADPAHDIYAFYRYHIPDPVWFKTDCRVTIQQMGNHSKGKLIEIKNRGTEITPVYYLHTVGNKSRHVRLLDETGHPPLESSEFPEAWINYLRSDDVCATAYFYLDRPSSNLPELPPAEVRLAGLKERVWLFRQ